MIQPRLFVEDPDHVIQRYRLSDAEYAAAISGFVIYCVDVILIDRERKVFYLARRRSKPMGDRYWVIGGRVLVGQTAHEAVCSKLRGETQLTVAEERLEFVTCIEYRWKDRQQTPQDAGCHAFAQIFALEVSDEELATANSNLDPNEYHTEEGLRAFTRDDLVNEGTFESLVYLYDKVFETIDDEINRLSRRIHYLKTKERQQNQ